jgi:hypothetical protein
VGCEKSRWFLRLNYWSDTFCVALHRLVGVCALMITLFSCFLGALCGWAAVKGLDAS